MIVQIMHKESGDIVIEISFEEFLEFGLQDEQNYIAVVKDTGWRLTE